jgi:hypothetical protein
LHFKWRSLYFEGTGMEEGEELGETKESRLQDLILTFIAENLTCMGLKRIVVGY